MWIVLMKHLMLVIYFSNRIRNRFTELFQCKKKSFIRYWWYPMLLYFNSFTLSKQRMLNSIWHNALIFSFSLFNIKLYQIHCENVHGFDALYMWKLLMMLACYSGAVAFVIIAFEFHSFHVPSLHLVH